MEDYLNTCWSIEEELPTELTEEKYAALLLSYFVHEDITQRFLYRSTSPDELPTFLSHIQWIESTVDFQIPGPSSSCTLNGQNTESSMELQRDEHDSDVCTNDGQFQGATCVPITPVENLILLAETAESFHFNCNESSIQSTLSTPKKLPSATIQCTPTTSDTSTTVLSSTPIVSNIATPSAHDETTAQLSTSPLTPLTEVMKLTRSFVKDDPMSPRSRTKKSYYVNKTVSTIQEYGLNQEEEIAIAENTTNHLKRKYKMQHQKTYVTKTKSRGKPVLLHTKKLAWNFWHDRSKETSDTFRPAKLRCVNKPKIQSGLQFASSVTLITQRKRSFYQSMWRINHETITDLYVRFRKTYPDNYLSFGTFFSLRPFYVRSVTLRDIEVCCCKMHLHARRGINALLECIKQHGLNPTEFTDYYSFLRYLTKNCGEDPYTHISWKCTPSKLVVCEHIRNQWENLIEELALFIDVLDTNDNVTVKLEHFQSVVVQNKAGEEKKHLKQITTSANLSFLITFLNKIIPEIIHHRNELKHFRTVNSQFKSLFDAVYLDLDFSENLTVPMKEQPQSMYWTQQVVSVHSGITKTKNGKTYHPYLSDSKKHDQVFSKLAMEEMLAEEDVDSHEVIIIESDNCSSQYKSGLHFYHLQELSNTYYKTLIRIYGIPSHGKGEVDHVGGTAKVTAKRLAATGKVFLNADDIADSLIEKYGENNSPRYVIKTISEEALASGRKEANSLQVATVDGSSTLRALVFEPHSTTFRGSKTLCICDGCKDDYGSCENFSDHDLSVRHLRTPHTRSQDVVQDDNDDTDGECLRLSWDFLEVGSIVAVAPDEESQDSVWFIKVTANDCIAGPKEEDKCGNTIAEGQRFLKGYFLERLHCEMKHVLFYLGEITYFYRETVFYPFVCMEECKSVKNKGAFKITNGHYSDILAHVEQIGYAKVS